MLSTVNHEQRLYVLDHGTGFTCLGFDVAYDRAVRLAEWAGVQAPNPALKGTDAGYADYMRCLEGARASHEATGRRCNIELTSQLFGLEGRRVEVVDCDGDKRRFWVGMSTGWMPCHLEITRKVYNRPNGGPAAMGPYQSVTVVR